ncbi:MAG: hypothetical protein KF749_14440 [Bacteroidetes bacterium]|nr:hypothetical protein [Bacteroidota bacterium]MCW5895701.1 hypothetical protein [Bacteroidota bacterium]
MKRIYFIAVRCLFVASVCIAQEKPHELGAELKAEVPALKEFHAVIFQLWHTAWPEKDIAMLRSLLPEVEKHANAVSGAELPGIFRDKKEAWEKGVDQLQRIVANYKNAVKDENDKLLLDVAEKLHTQYEKLVRVMRPPLAELDAFHTVLYPLYHYYLPEYNIENIKGSVTELKEKMSLLNNATLPEKRKGIEPVFVEKRAALSVSVDALAAAIESNNKETITAAIEKLHTEYQVLEHVLE